MSRIAPGQTDRLQRLIEKHRDAGKSFIAAMEAAQADLAQEDAVCKGLASQARRVSGRTLNDTQVELLCRGEMSRLAHDIVCEEIERKHRADDRPVAGRG